MTAEAGTATPEVAEEQIPWPTKDEIHQNPQTAAALRDLAGCTTLQHFTLLRHAGRRR